MENPHCLALGGIKALVVGLQQFQARVEQERAEEDERDLEGVDDGDTGEDEPESHGEGAEDSPEEHPVLVLRRDLEVGEEDRPDEDVVHAEALLDEVATHVLARGGTAELPQHDETEDEPDGDPRDGLNGGFLGVDDVRLAVDDEDVDQEQRGKNP